VNLPSKSIGRLNQDYQLEVEVIFP